MLWFDRFDRRSPHNRWARIGIAVWLLSSVMATGCGYRFAGSGTLPGNVQIIAVEMPENRSAESGLEVMLANELVRVFNQRSTVRVADSGTADARVLTVIQSVPVDEIARSVADQTTQQRVSVFVDVRLVDGDGRTVWARERIGESEAFSVGGTRAATDQARRSALDTVISQLADRLYRAMTDDF